VPSQALLDGLFPLTAPAKAESHALTAEFIELHTGLPPPPSVARLVSVGERMRTLDLLVRDHKIAPGWADALRCVAPGIRVTLIEPGVVATELPDHITHADTRQGVQEVYSHAAVTADDIAEVIAFALSRPRHLAINEVLLRPAGQL